MYLCHVEVGPPGVAIREFKFPRHRGHECEGKVIMRTAVLLIAAATLVVSDVRRLDAGEVFESSGVSLVEHYPPSSNPEGSPHNDIWGYTSGSGRRYAVVGTHEGTWFIEVTDPVNSVETAWVAAGNAGPTWRDMKTYLHYCYVVKDFDNVPLQILDLSDIDNGNVTDLGIFDMGAGLTRAHNIAINEETGRAYLIGSNIGGGGLVILDIATDPENPTIIGNWGNATGHDALVLSYNEGPFAGREIAFLFAYSQGVFVLDVTDPEDIFIRSQLIYPNVSIAHQGWISEDRNWLFIGDEGDENPAPTTTYVADVSDLDAITLETSFTNGLGSTDHNMMVRGHYLYEANYSSGLRIWDVEDVNNPVEVGYFDSYPENNNSGFPGAWAPYVGWDDSIVLLNDRNRGFFILDASKAIGLGPGGDAARPFGDRFVNRLCDEVSCVSDASCDGESVCIPPSTGGGSGRCYVPRSRYLSVRENPDNAGLSTARRVKVATGDGDVVVGWVGEPTTVNVVGPECGILGNSQLTAEIESAPYYTDWSGLSSSLVHVGGCAVSPGRTYMVQSIALGADSGDEGSYSDVLTLPTVPVYGDVTSGGGVAGAPDGNANLTDVQACILGFQNQQSAPKVWLDLEGSPSAIINLADAFSAVQGFQGGAYPGDDPCTCAGVAACP